MSYLRSGIFLAPFHNLTENPTLALERDMELLQHLDRLNYHEAWIGEHHSGGFEIIASPEVFIAAAAERTRQDGAARPHDARAGDVRRRAWRAGA